MFSPVDGHVFDGLFRMLWKKLFPKGPGKPGVIPSDNKQVMKDFDLGSAVIFLHGKSTTSGIYREYVVLFGGSLNNSMLSDGRNEILICLLD